MADLRPFKGLRYKLETGQDLGALLCPPYDVISTDLQETLLQQAQHNAVRLELSKELPTDSGVVNRYTRAAGLLQEWLSEGVLLPERAEAFYLLKEEYPHLGRMRTRCSVVARVRLEELSKGVVMPHEETSAGPKRDRFELLTATGANLSSVMGIYRDPSGRVAALTRRVTEAPSTADAEYDGTRIRMWVVSDRGAIQTVSDSLRDAPIYLADGHHRYETALRYRDIRRSESKAQGETGSDFVMMSLVEIGDPGLLVLPYHRALGGLSPEDLERVKALVRESFDVQPLEGVSGDQLGTVVRLEQRLEELSGGGVVLGLMERGNAAASLLTLKASSGSSSPLERCATWVLDRKVLEPVLGTQQEAVERGLLSYTHDSAEVVTRMNSGEGQLGLLLPPMALDLFEEVVLSGERMPIKSTYFSPKLPTGLVINRLA